MPPPLPERYSLEVRLGRDGDIEEWLATDVSLDRPVQIRILGPDADEERRAQFLRSVRGAAAVNHPHLTWVFTAGETPGGVYAVSEWTGAISLADRLAAGHTMDVHEFLPNAAGLAEGLATLHAAGVVHGAIDTSCVYHSVDHPAKLGGVGRPNQNRTASDDVRSLAVTLEEGLTGQPGGGPPPSEIVDGLSPAVDRALRRARQGLSTARQLADELGAAPSPVRPSPEPPLFSRRLLLGAIGLVLVAGALVFVTRLMLVGSNSPILVPRTSVASPSPMGSTTSTVATPPVPASQPALVPIGDVRSVDPFGGNEENDEALPNAVDGDDETVWRTEQYRDPLSSLKPGVGISFEVGGPAASVEVEGLGSDVDFTFGWSPEPGAEPDDFAEVVSGRTVGGRLDLRLPRREPGWWLLWFTELPSVDGDTHSAEIAEVRFRG